MNLNKGKLTISEITLSVKTTFGNELIQRNKIDNIKYLNSKLHNVLKFITISPFRLFNAFKGLFEVKVIYRQIEHGEQKELVIWLTPSEISFLKENL